MVLIGVGGHRLVFDIGNGLVKKVPKRDKYKEGSLQNTVEYNFYKNHHKDYPFLAKVVCLDGDDLIMEKVYILDMSKYDKFIDFSKFNTNIDNTIINKFIESFNFLTCDVYSVYHWGTDSEGRLKLVDYGINKFFINSLSL